MKMHYKNDVLFRTLVHLIVLILKHFNFTHLITALTLSVTVGHCIRQPSKILILV